MALSVASLLASLEDDNADTRRAAVRALAKGAAPCDEAALGLLAKRTEDSDEDVREEALLCLVDLVTRGSADRGSHVEDVNPDCRRKVKDAALRCLADDDGYVRRRAARATSVFCPRGDPEAISALVSCLGDDEREVRAAASDAVVEVCGQDNLQAVQEVMTLLQGSSGSTSSSGLHLLRRIAIRGDADALARSLEFCADIDEAVRWAAARAAGALCMKGDENVVEAMLRLLDDEDDDVRSVALEALAEAACRNHDNSCKAAMASLWDSSSDVRLAAVETLRALAPQDDFALLDGIRRCLSSEREVVRCAGLKALSATFSLANEDMLSFIIECSHDVDEEVRQTAIQTLLAIAPHGDARAVAAVMGCLSSDDDEDVRLVAANALPEMACKGSHEAIFALLEAFNDQDRHVRSASAEALASLTEVANEKVVVSLCKLLEDSMENVRQSAIDALRKVLGQSPIETATPAFDGLLVVDSVAEKLLSHSDEGVRCSAGLCLATLATPGRVEKVAKILGDRLCKEILEGSSDGDFLESVGEALALLAARADVDKDQLSELLNAIAPHASNATSPRLRALAITAVAKLAVAFAERYAREQVVAAMQSLCSCMGDPDAEVRATTIDLVASHLAHECETLSALTLDVCLERLDTAERNLQRAIASCLGQAWPDGNTKLIDSLRLKVASDLSPLVLRGVLECLAVTAAACAANVPSTSEGTEAVAGAIQSACTRLLHEEEQVRNSAVKVLSGLRCSVDKGGCLVDQLSEAITQQVCSAIKPLLSHGSEHVRFSSAKAVGASARPGDEAALELLLRFLDDSDEDVRWIALQSLPQAASRGNLAAVAAACRFSSDGDEQVRTAAVTALATLAEKGDVAVLTCLKARVQDSYDVAHAATRSMVALFSEEAAASVLEEVGSTVVGA